jgi:hypothetical protein
MLYTALSSMNLLKSSTALSCLQGADTEITEKAIFKSSVWSKKLVIFDVNVESLQGLGRDRD